MTPKGVSLLSVAVNVSLTAAKVIAGLLFASQTILADGLHSASDLVTDFAVLAGLRVTNKPADPCHPYGHRRVSTLVAMFVGACLIGAAGWIAYEAIQSLHDYFDGRSSPPVRAAWPFVAAVLSIPLKEILYRVTRVVGRRYRDSSLDANAWHHRTDAFSSIAAAVGLAAVWIGGASWRFLDPLTACVLAMFLIVVGVRIIRQSAEELVDRAPTEATLETIRKAIGNTEGVRGYHAIRARNLGGLVDMDVHVVVDPDLTVAEGHDIARAVRDSVRHADPAVMQVIVHIEPPEEEHGL